ncbi:hypothetical protein GCM10009733_020440 [Nonomuraea maheshkhaliensis]|uniref:DUF4326 domain-containing protein n=1 Tax=Nonomuraea maheshkhaliensis TaxID=419590 RepID=A0ABP4QW71_9ACTN
MSHALVVHCKRNPYDIYIGRPSKWGNPFVLGRDGTRKQVIASYERWLVAQPQLIAALPELAGKVLGCWCAPHLCHGDVLARMANQNSPFEDNLQAEQGRRPHREAPRVIDYWPLF